MSFYHLKMLKCLRIYSLNALQFNSLKLTRLYSNQIEPSSFTNYLVEHLGFSDHQSLSTSSRLQKSRGCKKLTYFEFAENANSVIKLFTQQGLDQSQITKIMRREPRIVIANDDKTLLPKFKALHEEGFSGSDVADIVAANPHLLIDDVDNFTLPAIRKLREILGSDSSVVALYKRRFWGLSRIVLKNLDPNVGLLQSYGIPLYLIRKRLLVSPAPYFRSPRVFEEAVVRVEEELGIPRSSKQFLSGVGLLAGFNEKTIQSKMEAFKSFGWTDAEVQDLCRYNPQYLKLSVLNIKNKLGFLIKELGLVADFVKQHPSLLTCSLEKRMVPRYKLLEVLRERGLLRSDYVVHRSFSMTEDSFKEKFVLPFEDVHDLYSELTGLPLKLPTMEAQKATFEPLI